MYTRIQFFFFIFFSLLSLHRGGTQSLHFHHLNQEEGLSNTFNAHFSVDGDGYFWTSSRDGLNRYDGRSVKVFRPTINGTPLDPNITSKVYHASDGKRWFTSNNALHALSRDQESMESWQFKSAENSYYYAFYLERDSLLWVQAYDSLYIVPIHSNQPDTVKPITALSGFELFPWADERGKVKGIANPLIRRGSGLELLFVERAGPVSRDTFFTSKPGVAESDTSLFYIYVENNRSLWMPGPIGLLHIDPYDPENWDLYSHDPSLSRFSYRDVVPFKSDLLSVASTRDGLFLFDMKKKEFVDQESILNIEGQFQDPQRFNSVEKDSKGNLWLSVFDYGILHASIDNAKFSGVLSPQQLKGVTLNIKRIIQLEDGRYIFAAANQGVFEVRKDGQFYPLRIPCIGDSPINYLYQDSEGIVWFIARDRVIKWDPATRGCSIKALLSPYAYRITELDENHMLLLGIDRLVTFPKDGPIIQTDTFSGTWKSPDLLSSLFLDTVHQLGFMMTGDNTLSVFQPEFPFRTLSKHSNIGFANDIRVSPVDKSIWIASSTGLYRFDPANHTVVNETYNNEGLQKSFTSVVIDTTGTIWLTSYQGVFAYDPTTRDLRAFTESDGLLSLQHDDNTAFLDNDGFLVMASDRGIERINPYEYSLNTSLPTIHLQYAEGGGIPLDMSNEDHTIIPYHQNEITIHFAAIEFSDPDQNQFRTHLIRNRTDTISTGSNLTVEYPNLREGNYQLHAYAANSDNVWTQDPYIVPFTIRPPWYRTWWARTLDVLFFLALVYGIYRVRVRQIARREAFKRKEAEYKQLVAETETAVLRLQMNPHFLFNSMNSINAYILQRDVDKASEYLNHFARLMRRILELSEHPLITVDEEIELLEQYLTAEAMRMSQPMTYSFEIDPDLDPDEVLLPTMLLQPFVENAIWHGLSPKDGGGHITIGFRQKGQTLECSVEDNGVGRARTESKHKTHRSKALEITRKRLNVLAEQEQAKTELQILDLTHPDGSPAGTRVMVTLPVL